MSDPVETVQVYSQIEILLEIGLVMGAYDAQERSLGPGPKYRCVQIHRGLNTVDASLAREWFRINKFLQCIQQGRIRIVDPTEVSAA